MRETWLMICSGLILDKCSASSRDEASEIFRKRSKYENQSESDILSEADYVAEKELDSFKI